MIRGKFDPSSRPDSVLPGAFNDFFGHLLDHGDAREKDGMKARIQDAVGSGCSLLMESIPNLGILLNNGLTSTSDNEGDSGKKIEHAQGALTQWNFLLCKLIEGIAHKSSPVVFFIDDLQWADETSLDSIQMLISDPDTRFCHYLISFRDDEEKPTERVTAIIDGIQSHGVYVTRIELGECVRKPPSYCFGHQELKNMILFHRPNRCSKHQYVDI